VGAQQAIEAMTKLLGDKSVVAVVAPSASSPSLSSRDTTAATGIAANLVQRDSATDGVSRVILLRGPRNAVAAAIGLIKGMDAPRLEVSIGVTVHDVENDVAKNLGLSWTYGNIQINEDNPNGLSLGSFSRAPLSFSATIAALETKSKSKLLAAPNVTVLDGERAFILIGSRLTFPVLIGYSQANTPIFNTQEERVGIYLQVAARISPDGTVTLSLYPQVSTVSGYIQVNGASYPQIATTEAQTTLQVKSGETIVLGGLMHDQELSEIDKVPILSSIPLLGELFKNRTRSKTSSQILITLTPVIQKPSK
jgi:type II secretory pathway component GspD/PulD (secretin)